MAVKKQTKVIARRKKFIDVEIPLTNSKIELIGNTIDELKDKTIKLDLTRLLKGKSVEGVFRVRVEDKKAVAVPFKIRLMPYFIRRMIRKRISYVEDSFETPSQESMLVVKPFLITRKHVSRVVRKTLRNKARNWLEDYIAERKDEEIFNDILSNKLQKPLSLVLKKTYPLSLCEIRILEVRRPLKPNEVPKVKPKKIIEEIKKESKIEEGLDQLKEIEDEKIKQAQKEIEKTQKRAVGKEEADKEEKEKEIEEAKEEIENGVEGEEKKSGEKNKKGENIESLSNESEEGSSGRENESSGEESDDSSKGLGDTDSAKKGKGKKE